MSQDTLFDAVNVDDRAECSFPNVSSVTAYRYGCRCVGCRKYKAAYHQRDPSQDLICRVLDCPNPRQAKRGAKYCALHTSSGQAVPNKWGPRTTNVCGVCGLSYSSYANRGRYEICYGCSDQSRKLLVNARSHHVPLDMIIQWIKNPACPLCGHRFYFGPGSHTAAFAIDHDHACCPGASSCGKCVRGVLCGSCNRSLGHVESMIARTSLAGVMAYLTRS